MLKHIFLFYITPNSGFYFTKPSFSIRRHSLEKFRLPTLLPGVPVHLVAIAAWRACDGTSVLRCDLFRQMERVVKYFKTCGFEDLTCPSHCAGDCQRCNPFGDFSYFWSVKSTYDTKKTERHIGRSLQNHLNVCGTFVNVPYDAFTKFTHQRTVGDAGPYDAIDISHINKIRPE